MQTIYIGNSLLGDELAIVRYQLISNILTFFAADVLDRAPHVAEAPHRGALQHLYTCYNVYTCRNVLWKT